MKHNYDGEVIHNVKLPKEDLEDLIDNVKDAVITIILTATAAQILKSIITNPRQMLH